MGVPPKNEYSPTKKCDFFGLITNFLSFGKEKFIAEFRIDFSQKRFGNVPHEYLNGLLDHAAFLAPCGEGIAKVVGAMIGHNFFKFDVIGVPCEPTDCFFEIFFEELSVRFKHRRDRDLLFDVLFLIFLLSVLRDDEISLEPCRFVLARSDPRVERDEKDRLKFVAANASEKLLLFFEGERRTVFAFVLDRFNARHGILGDQIVFNGEFENSVEIVVAALRRSFYIFLFQLVEIFHAVERGDLLQLLLSEVRQNVPFEKFLFPFEGERDHRRAKYFLEPSFAPIRKRNAFFLLRAFRFGRGVRNKFDHCGEEFIFTCLDRGGAGVNIGAVDRRPLFKNAFMQPRLCVECPLYFLLNVD